MRVSKSCTTIFNMYLLNKAIFNYNPLRKIKISSTHFHLILNGIHLIESSAHLFGNGLNIIMVYTMTMSEFCERSR